MKSNPKATGTHPRNSRVPNSAIIAGPEVTTELEPNKAPLVIYDDRNTSSVVSVSLLDGVGLSPDDDGRVLFVKSNVIHDVMTIEDAKGKFAIMRKNGMVVYGQQGFGSRDGVNQEADAGYDLVDIVALIEHNNSGGGAAANKKLDKSVADEAEEKAKAAEKAAKPKRVRVRKPANRK